MVKNGNVVLTAQGFPMQPVGRGGDEKKMMKEKSIVSKFNK